MSIIYSSTVVSYNSKGNPVVKNNSRTVIIHDFQSAYKTPIGDISEFCIKKTEDNYDIGSTLNDKPSKEFGTICIHTSKGKPLMDCCGKKILVNGYEQIPKIGSVIKYKKLFSFEKMEVAWIMTDDDFNKNIQRLIDRRDVACFRDYGRRSEFVNVLLRMQSEYSNQKYMFSLMSLDKVYELSRPILRENIELANNLQFLKVLIEESIRSNVL